MDNDKTMKRKTISLIAKNLILLLSVAVTGVIGAWSWFSNNTKATAEGISVLCEAPDGIEIAVVEHGAPAPADTEYSVGTLELDANSPVISNLNLTEITGDGVTFFKPQLQQKDGVAMPITGVDWSKPYIGRDYMSFDLYIRSEGRVNVFLDSESSVISNDTFLTGTNVTNGSTNYENEKYGLFSKDCIIGATRVAVLNSSSERQLLWIPRPDLQLREDTASVVGSKLFYIQENITQKGSTYEHYYWAKNIDENATKDEEAHPSQVKENGGKVSVTLGERKQIAELSKASEEDKYYQAYVTFNLWIEGEDSEARLALAGGRFKINLNLACEQIS